MEEYKLGWVRVRGIGVLDIKNGERTWIKDGNHDEKYPNSPYPISSKVRYWKNKIAIGGEGRIEGGRILKASNCGSVISLAECYPPPEYI